MMGGLETVTLLTLSALEDCAYEHSCTWREQQERQVSFLQQFLYHRCLNSIEGVRASEMHHLSVYLVTYVILHKSKYVRSKKKKEHS